MRLRFLILLSFFSFHLHSQDLSKWKYYKKIDLNTTAKGAGVTKDVINFPVAIILNRENFDFFKANKNGADIRVSAEKNGKHLQFELEQWDVSNQTALIWVKLPVVKGNSKDQSIWLHWGNNEATSMSQPQKVFDVKDGFLSVWHLSERPDTLPGTFKDATSNEAHGTGVNFKEYGMTYSRLGQGVTFDYPQNHWIKVAGDKRKLFDITHNLTFSIWAYAKSYSNKGNEANRSLPGYETMIAKGDNSWRLQKFGIRKWHKPESELIEICVEQKPKGDLCLVGKTDMVTGKWFHLTGVHEYPYVKLYVNGSLNAVDSFKVDWKSDDHSVGIGNQSQFPERGRQWDGILDEARVMTVSKDEYWIKLDYENQREDQRFLIFGKTQTRK